MELAISKISENGQIVIPSEIRKEAHIKSGMKFLIFRKNRDIHLKPITNENIKVMEDIEEGERDLREGRYIEVYADLSAEKIVDILDKQKWK